MRTVRLLNNFFSLHLLPLPPPPSIPPVQLSSSLGIRDSWLGWSGKAPLREQNIIWNWCWWEPHWDIYPVWSLHHCFYLKTFNLAKILPLKTQLVKCLFSVKYLLYPLLNSLPLVKFTMGYHPYFAETKAERLASSWGFYSGIVGTHHHGFLQNLRNQAHEVHFLDVMMHKEDCMEDYNLGWKFISYLFKNTLLLCELAKNIRKLNLVHYCFLT